MTHHWYSRFNNTTNDIIIFSITFYFHGIALCFFKNQFCCQVLTATELVSLAIRGLDLPAQEMAGEPADEIPDHSVVTAAQALVARIEKSAHAIN